jgi:hypothetical protein
VFVLVLVLVLVLALVLVLFAMRPPRLSFTEQPRPLTST